MKILHVISSVNSKDGGPIEGIKQDFKYSNHHKIDMEILCSDNKDSPWLKDRRLPKVHALGPKILGYAFNLKLVNWLDINIKKYDAIIVHGLWQYHNYAVWVMARKHNVPYYVYSHGMLDPWFKENYPIKDIKKKIYWWLIQGRILKDAKSVIFTANEERKLARKSYHPYNVKEKVIGYGINGNPYKLRSIDKLFFKKFPLLKNKRIILYFGRIQEKKGLDLLINAFHKTYRKNSSLHLVVVGPHEHTFYQKILTLVTKLKLEKYITFTGPLYNKLKWSAYKSCEVFCLSSHQENFGISVAEALSCSKPVLITNKINIYKNIKKFKSGFVSNDTEQGTIKNLKLWLALSKAEYKKMSINAYKCFKNDFHILNSSTKLYNMIKFDYSKK